MWTLLDRSKLVAQVPGRYQITGQVQWQLVIGTPPSSSYRLARIVLNRGLPSEKIIAEVSGFPLADTDIAQIVTTLWDMSLGDYVELVVSQGSGGALDVDSLEASSPEFMMVKV